MSVNLMTYLVRAAIMLVVHSDFSQPSWLDISRTIRSCRILTTHHHVVENLESMLNGVRPPLPTGNIKRESSNSSSSRASQQQQAANTAASAVGGSNTSLTDIHVDRSLSPPYGSIVVSLWVIWWLDFFFQSHGCSKIKKGFPQHYKPKPQKCWILNRKGISAFYGVFNHVDQKETAN